MQKRSLPIVLILCFFTLGVYLLYWMYSVRWELKEYLQKEDITPGLELLVTFLCAPYFYYWIYITSRDICRAEERAGIVPTDNSLLNLGLAFFCFPAAAILIMQGQLYDVADKA